MKTSMKTLLFLSLVLFRGFGLLAQECPETRMRNDEPVFYLDVDELPKFKSDDFDTALEYICSNIEYPVPDLDVSGSVIVSFIVTECGTIERVWIEKSLFEEHDDEVKRVLLSMPKWQPGKKNNKPVNTLLFLPVRFVLN